MLNTQNFFYFTNYKKEICYNTIHMTFIRKLLSALLLICLPLSSCDVIDSTSSIAQTDKEVILSCDNDYYQVERGDYLVLNVSAYCEDDSVSKAVTFSLEQDGFILSFLTNPIDTDGVIEIATKNVGKSVVVATSSANRNSQKRIQVEVIKHIPSLPRVWNNLNQLTNYSLTTYRTKKDDRDKTERTTLIEVTPKAIVYEEFDWDDENQVYYLTPVFSYQSWYELGCGIDKNGNAFTIGINDRGQFNTNATIEKTQQGFLNKDNFIGYKDKTTSINDVGFFYGLQAINPHWLSDIKTRDNRYPIDDYSNEYNSNVAFLLWKLIDPIGMYQIIQNNNDKSINELLSYISIEIQVTQSQEVEFTLLYKNLETDFDVEEYIYTTKLIDVGTTDISQIPGLNSFLDSFEAKLPALPSDLQIVKNALEKNNYVYEIDMIFRVGSNKRTTKLYVYYTENYFMAYYSPEVKELYRLENQNELSSDGFGYLKKSDGIYSFYYHEQDNVKIQIDAKVPDSQGVELWDCDFHLAQDYRVPNYFISSTFYQRDSLYAFSNYSMTIFDGFDEMYYTLNQDVFSQLVKWYLGENVDYKTVMSGISVQWNESGKLDHFDICCAFEGSSDYYELFLLPRLSHFGHAEEENSANSYIQEELRK